MSSRFCLASRSHCRRTVAQFLVRPILQWAPAEPHFAHANPHGGLSGLRTHRQGDPRTPRLIRHHALHLRLEPVLAVRPRTRGSACGTPRTSIRTARRTGRARAGKRPTIRACAGRRRDAAYRQYGISAHDEEAPCAREHFARCARRLRCARAGAA